jgi:hypothetical protein
MGLCVVSTVVYFLGCAWENRRRDRREVVHQDLNEDEMSSLGDAHPDFRFIL